MFRNPDAAARVGARYLRSHRDEASEPFLRAAIGLDASNSWAAPRQLASRISNDFARGDLVTIGGWVLARSECRMCALVALQGRAHG